MALVNPNRYLEPPVIPVGIEYVAHYLHREGHDVRVVDLAFAPDPDKLLVEELQSFRPEVVGFSLRNSDTCLYHDSVFFLDDFARLVEAARRACGARMVIGGTGLLAGPREVADYLGCDHAVYGPGERAFPRLLGYLGEGVSPPRIINGWESSFDRGEVPSRGRWVDYTPYIEARGVAGFATQTGCTGDCCFCLEAGLPWRDRGARSVAEELGTLEEAGCGELHLCDSEFNQDLEACKKKLRAVAAAGLDISWSLYMKPLPHDEALMRMLADTGADSVTLSVDSDSLERGSYGFPDLESFITLARSRGIKVAVDLLIGFPRESLEEARRVLDFFSRCRPDAAGVNAWIRLYKYTRLGMLMRAYAPPKGSIEGSDPDFLKPVFYNWITREELAELIGGDPLFRIEGLERRSNYERLH